MGYNNWLSNLPDFVYFFVTFNNNWLSNLPDFVYFFVTFKTISIRANVFICKCAE